MANGRISLRYLLKVAIFLHSFSILDSRRISLASFESTCQQSSFFTVYGPYYGLLWCKSAFKCCGHIACVRFTVKGYFGFRACRYPNSDSTFNLSRLVISGDICPNPGRLPGNRAVRCASERWRSTIDRLNVRPAEAITI